jgi:hypothetical protein
MSGAPTAPGALLALVMATPEDERRAVAELLSPPASTVVETDRDVHGAAKYAQLSAKSIRRASACGQLKSRKVASRLRFTTRDLDEWLDAGAPTKKTDVPGASTRSRPTVASSAAAAIRGTGASS